MRSEEKRSAALEQFSESAGELLEQLLQRPGSRALSLAAWRDHMPSERSSDLALPRRWENILFSECARGLVQDDDWSAG